jgi:GNAT superfamily N-acetyltransferase
MAMYSLLEVTNASAKREFVMLPVKLYNNYPNWVRPLDKDVESVFDRKKNKLFRTGDAIRWILVDEKNGTVGRIAAFYDANTVKAQEQPTGGIGFFECINCEHAAYMLFDSCKRWLASKGLEAMDGPINFGDRDRWWGLHIDGDLPPNYCMGYHLNYYQQLFIGYGFREYFRQFTYGRKINNEGVDPVVWEKAQRITQNPNYSVVNISKRNLDGFANDFMTIYNLAWGRYTGVQKMTLPHAKTLMNTIKPILDEKLIYFAYFQKKPIGFFVMLPELNQIVSHLNGTFGIVNKLKFLYLLRVKKICTKALGIIFGIVPQHQGKGVEGALINEFAKHALRPNFQYTELELNWIADFNPAMQRVAEQIGAKVCKTHITFRYMFDREKAVTPPKKVS